MQTTTPRKLFIKSAIIIGIALLIFLFGLFPELVLDVYVKGFYPIISSVLRWVSSLFPFAVGDILYVILILYLLRLIVRFCWRLKKKGWQKTDKLTIPIYILNAFLILFISFKLLWGLNYSRPSITKQLNISDKKYDVKELVSLGNYFIDKLNKLQPQISSKLTYDINQLREKAVADYKDLVLKNPFFKYNVPSVKPVINGWLISKIGIEGYYNPLSGEANVNMKLPAWVLPFVTCHEISHQMGVAREDEANLVAYLVGINSKDVNFQYSVNYNMLRYILFEIRFKSPEDYLELKDKISPGVLANFKAENEFWAKYSGQMSNYMGIAFDKFLKLNNQKKGIKSYQNIVVWLWNIHKDELKKSESLKD
ncbi:DUF3810 domain-containing protein [Pedobacter frigiditerrae]|uniref:DUF3810 domain-containing protein n=1 Tax=Pedobacter frigiditerrae TaxID=2530452 RepID=A0A4R0MYV8_9SPHI|nr:DUF3810 domain-containing protein [Pedobacter frigiditerrae]TCC92113.1 DUF3810 domain-containing protein [Pedobacter frigiditerrae]